jgi:hypothetical protein
VQTERQTESAATPACHFTHTQLHTQEEEGEEEDCFCCSRLATAAAAAAVSSDELASACRNHSTLTAVM